MSRSTHGSEPSVLRSSAEPEQQVVETPAQGSFARFELLDWRTSFRVLAGITGRGEDDDSFDFALGPTREVQVLERWMALQAELGAQGVVVSRQVHGARVAWHSVRPGLTILQGLDGHGTSDAGLLLAVTVADCIPVYILDPRTRSIALLHAGWKGTAAGVLTAGIGLLREYSGSRVQDLLMHCGPGICGSCYEVGSEVMEAVGHPPEGGEGSPYWLDLRRELTTRARALGVSVVTESSLCTIHTHGAFFSHRASGGRDGRMVAYLLLLP